MFAQLLILQMRHTWRIVIKNQLFLTNLQNVILSTLNGWLFSPSNTSNLESRHQKPSVAREGPRRVDGVG